MLYLCVIGSKKGIVLFTNCSFETIYITIKSVLLGYAMFIFASGKDTLKSAFWPINGMRI